MSRHRITDELRPRDRVVAVLPVGTVPVGAEGVVKMVVGQAWTRYWVAFDGGSWVNGVDASQIVRVDRYDEWKVDQERAAAVASSATPAATAAAEVPGAAPADGPASGIPTHLLERSKQARARKEAAAAAAS